VSRWRELAITGQRSFVNRGFADLTLWGTGVTLSFRSEFAFVKVPAPSVHQTLGLPKNTIPTFLRHTLLVESEPTSQGLLGEQMGNRFLREKEKTQRLVVAAIEQGGLRHKVKELARRISTLAISYWHFPR
jgi:hypothetical protein